MSAVPPAAPPRPLAGADRQVLIGLRATLAVYILLAIGSTVFSLFSVGRYISVAIQLILRTVLSLPPPAGVLLAVSVRTPPAAIALDAAAGLGIASILFRFGFLAFSGLFSSTVSQLPDLAFFVLRIGVFTVIDAGIAGMAIHLRRRAGPMSPGALIVATVAFLIWDGLVHAAMQALIALIY